MFSLTIIIPKLSIESNGQVNNFEFYNSLILDIVENNFIFNDNQNLDKLKKLCKKMPQSKIINNKKKFLGRKRLNAQYTDKGYDNHSEIIK